MALESNGGPYAVVKYELTEANTTAGTYTIGKLPVGYLPVRIKVVTQVAGTGSSSPTFSLGISGSTAKYKADGALTVTAGHADYTLVSSYAAATAEETLLMTTTGTLPTNTTYSAWLLIECIRVDVSS